MTTAQEGGTFLSLKKPAAVTSRKSSWYSILSYIYTCVYIYI